MSEKITIKFSPYYTDSGLTSWVSWNNANAKKMFEEFFYTREGEILTGIEIDDKGITARFERVK